MKRQYSLPDLLFIWKQIACLCEGRRPGVARQASNFFSRRRKKVTKERATLLPATPSLRSGATWGARSRGAPQNSLRADALRSNNCGESVHEAWALRRACHPAPCAPQAHPEGNPRIGHPHGPLLRSAQLSQRVARAPARWGRAQQRPVRLLGYSAVGCSAAHPPAGCAWGAQGAGWHARRSAHAS